ncbi:hypothetical protein [Synoicihabitans lomoniglobus]|uniref:Uncharacterized protein n=1 Tax=Synoicihabitans lomoniglobus TaxID=2909285 RepID=A0AAF0I482_9BACT|nr:hypothetical protein [Opitutaceae bacterium LMO-M01]WED67497.1 hypothetical protein PXH66_11610 [Opitutaceae bacterium LMO-M01]
MNLPSKSLLLVLGPLLFSSTSLGAEKAKLVTFAQTHDGYHYDATAATPAAERATFIIAEGKFNVGGPSDATLDAVPFETLSRKLAIALSRRGYAMARNPDQADLLILVHRGRTNPRGVTEHSGSPLDTATAGSSISRGGGLVTAPGNQPMVGFSSGGGEVVSTDGNLKTIAAGLGWLPQLEKVEYELGNVATDGRYERLVEELSQERYYIVLEAFDFAAWRKTNAFTRQWETRLSFLAERQSFAERYAAMIKAGTEHFARDTPAALDRRFVTID